MNEENYLSEKIPDFEVLIKKVLKSLNNNENMRKYSFDELFKKHPRGFYEKNSEVFEKIGLNTKLKDSGTKLNEIKGLYIFYQEDAPIYVGISRKLIRRLKNHFLGKSHFVASLTYLMAKQKYNGENGKWTGKRKDFPFEDYRKDIQNEMIDKWKIAIIPETNNYNLYVLEVGLACTLKTKWNSFETH